MYTNHTSVFSVFMLTVHSVFPITGVQEKKCKMEKLEDSVVSLCHCPFCVFVNNPSCLLQFISPLSLVL